MKRLILIGLLCLLPGCKNPIGSAVEKEGEETRQQMQTELAVAKAELTNEMREQMNNLFVSISGQIVPLAEYLQTLVWLR
jgi:hypothetical protein